jgi:hypothetical protein
MGKSYLSFNRGRFFRNQPIRNKNGVLRPCLLTDRDKMSNLYRWPSIDASYQVSVHLAKRFQRRRFFKKRPIRNKNCLWWPLLIMDWDKMCNLLERAFYRCFLPSFSSFGWGVSEEKIKMWKVNRRWMPIDGNRSHCLWQGELKMYIYLKDVNLLSRIILFPRLPVFVLSPWLCLAEKQQIPI